MLKINLPSPYEDETDIKQWFALMRVALKATEKTYEEFVKNLTEEERKNVNLRFNNSFDELEKVKRLQEELDSDYLKTQEVWIEIDRM